MSPPDALISFIALARTSSTHNARVLVFVSICCHVPNNLMCEQLREFGCLDYIPLNISEYIIAQRLNNLWDIEECHVDGVAFQCPHSILDDKWIVAVFSQEIRYCCYRIHGGPIE